MLACPGPCGFGALRRRPRTAAWSRRGRHVREAQGRLGRERVDRRQERLLQRRRDPPALTSAIARAAAAGCRAPGRTRPRPRCGGERDQAGRVVVRESGRSPAPQPASTRRERRARARRRDRAGDASASGSPRARISACVRRPGTRRGGTSPCPPRVKEQPGRTRVAVARLADRAGVEEPAAVLELGSRAARREPAGELLAVPARARARRGCGRRARAARVVSSNASSATCSLSTYSQTGSRGLAWKSSAPSRASPTAAATRARPRASSPSTPAVQRAAGAGIAGELPRCRARRARPGRGSRRAQTVGTLPHQVAALVRPRRRSRRRRRGTTSRRRASRSMSASTASSA